MINYFESESFDKFVACEFIDCNFSNTIIKDTAFKDVEFINCKLLGVKFNECDPFLLQFSFKDCQLNFSSFYQLKMTNTELIHCNLKEVDFTESNLSNAVFDHCDLKNAIFEQSNLEKTDFRTAYNFRIHPEENKLKGAIFSKENIFGLVSAYGVILK